jgi:MFS transporter, putative metabolite:H+ symporter
MASVHPASAARLMPLSGPARLLTAEHWKMLWLLGTTSFFEGYDLNVLIVALPRLRAAYHLDQADAALWVSAIYLGALPAILLARRADRRGRRRLLLLSMSGYALASLATALAPSIGTFVACQCAAHLFLTLESVLVWTMVAEEMPAGARGFGFGWLATFATLGVGWSAILYGLILEPAGVSWRWLYVASIPVLVVVGVLRRRLPESRRFVAVSAEPGRAPRFSVILRPPYRRPLILVCVTAILLNLTTQAVVFVFDFMVTERHLSSMSADLVLIGAGAVALPVLLIAGRTSDRFGRKPVCCAFLLTGIIGLLSFFLLARGIVPLFGALTLTYVGQFGAWPTGSGFGAELFPTSLRALGGSAAGVARVVGQSASFVIAGALIHAGGSVARSVVLLTLGPLAAAVIIGTSFPETAGQELECLAPAPGDAG